MLKQLFRAFSIRVHNNSLTVPPIEPFSRTPPPVLGGSIDPPPPAELKSQPLLPKNLSPGGVTWGGPEGQRGQEAIDRRGTRSKGTGGTGSSLQRGAGVWDWGSANDDRTQRTGRARLGSERRSRACATWRPAPTHHQPRSGMCSRLGVWGASRLKECAGWCFRRYKRAPFEEGPLHLWVGGWVARMGGWV